MPARVLACTDTGVRLLPSQTSTPPERLLHAAWFGTSACPSVCPAPHTTPAPASQAPAPPRPAETTTLSVIKALSGGNMKQRETKQLGPREQDPSGPWASPWPPGHPPGSQGIPPAPEGCLGAEHQGVGPSCAVGSGEAERRWRMLSEEKGQQDVKTVPPTPACRSPLRRCRQHAFCFPSFASAMAHPKAQFAPAVCSAKRYSRYSRKGVSFASGGGLPAPRRGEARAEGAGGGDAAHNGSAKPLHSHSRNVTRAECLLPLFLGA